MNYTKKIGLTALSFFAFLLLSTQMGWSQEWSLVNAESSLKVSGTSSLHDWTIDSGKQSGTLVFKNLETGEIEGCSLSVKVEGLESGKRAMNKNTYKALKHDTHKNITFNVVDVLETTAQSDNSFLVKTKGDLVIAGVKKRITLNFTLIKEGSSATLKGEKKINMTDFNIDPPTALLGTITTGDAITITFKTKFK
ncbi:YceI family protein [Bizionia paragorgiae]|uniref:Polyisoprenoid-binding protein YceI n=1 Tax=Bizionia paragorgiae TaxID=283786 RepID=A0A1H3WHX3_BIZPA|nr:YceI family protein [Bizionia paragorgiae]SDZ86715.1 Polyisoprenoid-binding protein YceI [Bizionia paragorgiae]